MKMLFDGRAIGGGNNDVDVRSTLQTTSLLFSYFRPQFGAPNSACSTRRQSSCVFFETVLRVVQIVAIKLAYGCKAGNGSSRKDSWYCWLEDQINT